MEKRVLISMTPDAVNLIFCGERTMLVRKTRPALDTPFKCYVYCQKRNRPWAKAGVPGIRFDGKVVAEFVCDDIIEDRKGENCGVICKQGGMLFTQIKAYGGNDVLYGWHISDLQIFDMPMQLENFKPWLQVCEYSDLGLAIPKCEMCHGCKIEKPPHGWRYVKGK